MELSKKETCYSCYKPFQNDSWIVNTPDEDFIINSYKNFVQSLRIHYPNASIICALGSMDAVKPRSLWPGYIETAVAMINAKKIFTHFFAI